MVDQLLFKDIFHLNIKYNPIMFVQNVTKA